MAYADPEVGKARGRERFHRRVAERLAAGLCTRCGREPPETGRKTCQACAEKRRIADRQRDARLRAAGLPRRDIDRAREYERERSRRVAEERAARALCTKCGVNPPEDGRRWCEPCLATRREDDRVRYEKAAASGLTYGGRDPEKKRRNARAASKKRREARLAAGSCTRCGRSPAVEGGTTCEPCRVSRRQAETGSLCRPEIRRTMRQMRRPHDGRGIALRALFGAGMRARRPGTSQRDEQEEILVAAVAIALYGLQRTQPGGGEVRELRPPQL